MIVNAREPRRRRPASPVCTRCRTSAPSALADPTLDARGRSPPMVGGRPRAVPGRRGRASSWCWSRQPQRRAPTTSRAASQRPGRRRRPPRRRGAAPLAGRRARRRRPRRGDALGRARRPAAPRGGWLRVVRNVRALRRAGLLAALRRRGRRARPRPTAGLGRRTWQRHLAASRGFDRPTPAATRSGSRFAPRTARRCGSPASAGGTGAPRCGSRAGPASQRGPRMLVVAGAAGTPAGSPRWRRGGHRRPPGAPRLARPAGGRGAGDRARPDRALGAAARRVRRDRGRHHHRRRLAVARSPVHVFVNPQVFDPLRPRGAQVVISHEATHVATEAALPAHADLAARGLRRLRRARPRRLPVDGDRRADPRPGPPHGSARHLPGQAEFDADDRRSGLATRRLAGLPGCSAERYGQRRLVASTGPSTGLVDGRPRSARCSAPTRAFTRRLARHLRGWRG